MGLHVRFLYLQMYVLVHASIIFENETTRSHTLEIRVLKLSRKKRTTHHRRILPFRLHLKQSEDVPTSSNYTLEQTT